MAIRDPKSKSDDIICTGRTNEGAIELRMLRELFTNIRGQLNEYVEANAQLLRTFAIFLVSIPVFGFAYFALFNANPSAFIFSSDIVRSRKNAASEGLVYVSERLADLRALQAELATRSRRGQRTIFADEVEPAAAVATGRRLYVVRIRSFTTALASPNLVLSIYNRWQAPGEEPDRMLARLYLSQRPRPASVEAILPGVGELIHRCERIESRLARLTTVESLQPVEVSYFDFLYFSTVTAATVGYGDILPNTTSARRLVVLQILFTSFVVVVAINAVLRRPKVRGVS